MATPGAVGSSMLAIPEKKTTPLDLYLPLRNYVASHYSEREAQLLEVDFVTVRDLRTALDRPSPTYDVRRDSLNSYFRAISLMEPRFPISFDSNHINSIIFTWMDAFRPSKKASQPNIHLEKAAVLFNLGSVHSQMGLAADRTSPAGLKVACNSFQAAAGAFAFLRDIASMKAALGPGGLTIDISAECAGMLEKLMLAQAQECFFEKVLADAKPPGLCSKVARQVGLYYEEAHAPLSASPLSQHFERTWIKHVQLKVAQFYAESCYRYALELHEKDDIGQEIARLRAGLSALSNAKKSTKGVAATLLEAVTRLESNMNHNLERAMKENDRVYFMRVPAISGLEPLPAASLVKPVAMGEVLDSSEERLFSSLVPDSSAKALSRYTDMVDGIIRTQAEKLQQGREISRVKLKEMDLPDSILALEGSFTLPVDLKEDVEAVKISGGPCGLEAELQELRDLRRVNQEMVVQTEELLQKEADEDAEFRNQFGTRWTRPHSSTLTKNLQDRLKRFGGNLKQAGDSDARIECALREHMELMLILECRPIESALPSLARPLMSLDVNEDAIVGALKRSLMQLETLGAQRAGLEDMLKEMKRKDDILPKLMATSGSYEDLFRKEISKYDKICQDITQNIEEQDQLLLQIQAQNEDFTAVFNLKDYKVSREKGYKHITAAASKYREIKDNINEGLKFYVTLQDAISNVKQQCSDFAMTRKIQCHDMIEEVQRQVAGLDVPSDGRTGYNYPSYGQLNQQRSNPPQAGPQNSSRPLPPYNHPSEEQPRPGISQPYPPYTRPPYFAAGAGAGADAGAPYHHQHPRPPSGQPAHPGWRPPYFNTNQLQSGAPPASTYTVPTPYPPPGQGRHYNNQ